MKRLISHFLISLDGVVESPDKWSFPYFDGDMGAEVAKVPTEMDAFLMGRVLYDEWSQYWPAQSGEDSGFADFINNVPKFVVSNTLDDADWNNTTVIRGDLAEEIGRLKDQPGTNIGMSGSTTLVRSLLKAGLIDELRLSLHPIVVADGQRLFDGLPDRLPLTLAASKTTGSGIVNLSYHRARIAA
jgi:dihydrofolate reductase